MLRLSPDQRAVWLAAIVDAEGSQRDNHTVIYQDTGPLCDAIVLAGYLEGFHPTVRTGRQIDRQIGLCAPHVSAGKLQSRVLDQQPVWCVTTELGSWTAEQDGQVFLTGNSLGHGHPYNLGDYVNQIISMAHYIAGRYGSPAAAWGHEQCVPLDAEILTRRGWLHHDELEPGDETLGYNDQTGRNEWTPVQGITRHEDAPLVRLSNKTWSAECTPGHRWQARHWVQRRHGGPANVVDDYVTADRITSRHSLRLAAEASTGDGPAISLQEAELLGWVLGDGSVAQLRKRGKTGADYTGAVSVRLYQSKPDHVKRIDALVGGLMFNRMTRQMRTPADEPGLPLVTWEFTRTYSSDLLKRSGYDHLNPVPFALSLSPDQRAAFLRGVHGADGGYTGTGHIRDGYPAYARTRMYYQNDGAKQEAIILALYLSGHRPGIHARDPAGKRIGRWTVTTVRALISQSKSFIGGEKIRREEIASAPVWCPQTALGTWTMRQGRNVMLTGNSFNWYGGGLTGGVFSRPDADRRRRARPGACGH